MASEATPAGAIDDGPGVQQTAAHAEPAGADRPYRRSWVNVLVDGIDRLPGPTWLTYLVLVGLGALANGVFAFWGADTRPADVPIQAMLGAMPVLVLWAFHHLRDVAANAFDEFRPALEGSDPGASRLRYELTVVPAAIGWICLLVAALPPPTVAGGGEGPGFVFRLSWSMLTGALTLVFVFQIVRQLWTVGRVHARATRVDLFRAPPLFAFSILTARTAIILAALVILAAAVSPSATPIGLAVSGTLLALAVAVFVVPLRGMRRRIVAEKHRLQIEVGSRIETTIARIHEAVDRDDTEAAARMHDALAVLVIERDLIERLPTLPWRPSTAGAVLSVTVLPVVLFAIQRLISQAI
jgi:hypothetical protein